MRARLYPEMDKLIGGLPQAVQNEPTILLLQAEAAMNQWLAEVEKTKLFVAPTTGEEIHALIDRIYATPPNVVAKALDASKGK